MTAISNPGFDVRLLPGEPLQLALDRLWLAVIDGAAVMCSQADSAAEEARVVHQLRVSVKRLRAVLQMTRTTVDQGVRVSLDRDLRRIARDLAAARRDAVLRDARQQLLDGSQGGESHPLADLTREALAQLQARRATLGELLGADCSWQDFSASIKVIYRRARRRYQRWRRSGELGDAHACRKFVKYLKYALEFIEPLDPGELEPLGRRLHDLEETLGELNDLRDLCEVDAQAGSNSRVREQLAGRQVAALASAAEIFKPSVEQFANLLQPARDAWRKPGARNG